MNTPCNQIGLVGVVNRLSRLPSGEFDPMKSRLLWLRCVPCNVISEDIFIFHIFLSMFILDIFWIPGLTAPECKDVPMFSELIKAGIALSHAVFANVCKTHRARFWWLPGI